MPDYLAPALCASLFFALGSVLQKRGIHTRLAGLDYRSVLREPRAFASAMGRNRVWLFGTALFLLGTPLSIQAMALGDVGVVKPLMRVQLLVIVALGVAFLGEKLRRAEWWGMALLLAGALGLAGRGAGPAAAPPEISACATLLGVTLAACGGVLVLHQRRPRWMRQEIALGICCGLLMGAGDVLLKAATSVAVLRTGSFDVTEPASLLALFSTPLPLLSVFADVTAFLLAQAALASGRVSILAPLSSGTSVLFTVTLGHLFLGEAAGLARAVPVAAVIGGAVLLSAREGGSGRAEAQRDSFRSPRRAWPRGAWSFGSR